VVAEAAASDNLNMQGTALMDLAEVLQLAGRSAEATAPLRAAAEAFDRKGNIVAAAKARARLDAITVAT